MQVLRFIVATEQMASTVETATRHHQQQHISTCSACRMAHGSCPLRSGLFTRSHLHAGLNLVATIPRGACNINVTEMAPSMNRLAVRTHRDSRFVLNGGRGTPDWPGDYTVAGTIVSYTRGAHGRGEALWAPGPLTEAVDIMVMAKQHNPGIHYQYHVPAGPSVEGFPTAALQPSPLLAVPWNQGDVAEDEVAWRVAGLTPCSQSCGGGTSIVG
ncbi:UNVERIFIED_CONTAM: hypothetical protein B566_EDAN019013 [Ephemera danica]|nr:hypothetical protein B566_EDAN019013 [Ephemera danica]